MNAAVDAQRYFAFISYSHQDEAWAQWLHKALETWRVPSRLVGQATSAGAIPSRLLPIFRDREELASATDLGRTVNAALAQSKNLIVICSPNAAKSRWVNEEVLAFKRLGNAERIFCLIVAGEPNASDLPGREPEECFAPALRFTVDSAGQPTAQRTEPIAADARYGKDGKANAKLKLIAGLLDVGFDALKQRELQRRNRRLAALSVAALIVVAITTTLAITAVIARGDAERRQKQAEELVGFMLGDLNDKLREVKRVDILKVVDDKAMAYFASLPTKDVTDDTLSQRVTALEKIGNVRSDQANNAAALESYEAAAKLAAQILERKPGDVDRQAEYADALKWVGQAYWYQGDLDHALQKFEEAASLLQRAADARPNANELAFKLAAARNNAGHVLETRGKFDVAAQHYQAVLKIYERLTDREPSNARWRSYLGDAYNNLGKLTLEQGNLFSAISSYRADVRIKEAIVASDPNNNDAKENLLISQAILGRTLGLCGELESAERYSRLAVESARVLMAFDPTNAYWQEYFALYGQQLGGLIRQQKRFDEAAAVDAESVHSFEALVAKDANNSDWRQELAQSRLEYARLQRERSNLGAAAALGKTARDAIDELLSKDSENRSLILLKASADTVLGQLAAARNDLASARDYWASARKTLTPVAQSENGPSVLATWVTLMLLTNELDEAMPIIDKLAAMGYRTPDLVELARSKRLDYPDTTQISKRIADAIK